VKERVTLWITLLDRLIGWIFLRAMELLEGGGRDICTYKAAASKYTKEFFQVLYE